MLRMNQLAGFGVRSDAQFVAPSLRFTKNYSYTFSGTSATVTIGSADLGAADPTKQILAVVPSEAPTLTTCTIDGVRAGLIHYDGGIRLAFFSAPYTGSGPFNIVINSAAIATESNSLLVYEVLNAALLYKGMRSNQVLSATTAVTAQSRTPINGLFVGGGMDTTDTASFTWGSLTENADLDGGDSRIGSASNATPAVAATDLSETLTASTSSLITEILLSILPTNQTGVTGGLMRNHLASGSTTTWTISSANADYTNLGDFKLVIGVMCAANVTISGVTFNGNALTSLGSVVNTGPNPDILCHFFHIDVTQAGGAVGSIVVTASGTVTSLAASVICWALYGVGSISAVQSSSGNAAGAAVNIDVAAGGMILALHNRSDNTQTITWSGAAELFDLSFTVVVGFRGGGGQWSYAPAETGRSIQASGTSGQYATLAIAFNP